MILPDTITVMDVRNCIQYPSYDVGVLCSSGEGYVNKWSKYKPVRYRFEGYYPTNWWKATSGNCGIGFVKADTIGRLLDQLASGAEQFPYEVPRGGAAEPYRLADFAGYNSTAYPPIMGMNVDGNKYTKNGASGAIRLQVQANMAGGTGLLTAEDLYGTVLRSCYYAVAIRQSGSSVWQWMTASTSFAESNTAEINFPLASLAATSYDLVQFVSNKKQTTPVSASGSGWFAPIPMPVGVPYMQTVHVTTTTGDVKLIKCMVSNTSGLDTLTVTINVDSPTGDQVFSNCSLKWYYGNKGPSDPQTSPEEGSERIDDFSAPAGQITNHTVSVQKEYILPDWRTKGNVIYFFANGVVQGKGSILDFIIQ